MSTQVSAADRLVSFASEGVDLEAEKQEAAAVAEEFLMEQRRGRMSQFTHKDLFGEAGAFRALSKDEQRELLTAVLDTLNAETQHYINHRENGIDWDEANLDIRLKHLLDAAKNGVFIPNWKEHLAFVERATHSYFYNFSSRCIRENREQIQDAAVQIEQLLGEVPEGITGKGLEFAPSSVGGGKKVYLNGKFVAATVNARFSDKPTNGEVVAWLVVEQIDHCNIRGSQMSWKVFAFRDGLKEPERVFEDHAYDAERSLHVDAPVVEDNGDISVVINGQKSQFNLSLAEAV